MNFRVPAFSMPGMTGSGHASADLFVPCLSDNFGVLLPDPQSGATASIDAPEAAPVAALGKNRWRLTDILVTHHHADPTAGIGELKAKHKCSWWRRAARAADRACR